MPQLPSPLQQAEASKAGDVWRFAIFLASGGSAALVNVVSRFLLTPVMGFKTSIVVAYLLGMVVAFVLFRAFVFQRSGASLAQESIRFVVVNGVALVLVWVTSVMLADVVFPAIGLNWHPQDIAHLIGTSVPAISSYIGHSRYTFKRGD